VPDAATLARYDQNRNGQLDPEERAAMARDQAGTATAATTSTAATPTSPGGNVIELSPFTVSTARDTGYFAENTLAGSRLNTNLADLGASITVVTKQQLEDTGALDINDVFMYEANTEGANTYTPINVNRSNLTDNIGGWSGDDGSPFGIATANRVRGLGRADTAQNNYPTIARLPFDSYNTNSVEISRGPNSMLFGTGSPAGIVNQSPSEAALNRFATTVSGRYGSFDAYRASIGTNVPLGSKLAIYAAALYDSRGFQRKPSSDVYRRQYGTLTFQPFRTTKITASYEHYDNYNNRPNYLPPQDLVTPWLQAGRPGWNPVTQRITFADGRVTQPYLNSTLDARYIAGVTASNDGQLSGTTSPFYIPGIAFATRNSLRIDQGRPVSYWVGSATAGGTPTTGLPADAARTQAQREIAARRLTQSTGFVTPIPPASTGATGYQTWLPVHVTDKSIYNWEEYNISGANYGTQEAHVYNVELQQQILPNLFLSAGFFRQEFDEWTHYGLGQANQAPRLYVDTNSHLLDGTPNPYFGSPYVLDWQADTFYRPETNDNYRGMLTYDLDLRQKSNWMRFLGRHRFLGLVSEQRQWTNNLRYRLSSDSGDPRFLPNTNTTPPNNFSWAGNSANIQRIYYVGQNQQGVVQRGIDVFGTPAMGGPESATLNYYDWPTGTWRQTEMGMHANLFYAGGGYGVNTRDTKSRSFAWQAWLWEDRIIPTFGWRTDELELRAYNGRNPDGTLLTTPQLYTGGAGNPGFWNNLGPVVPFEGDTITRGGVIRPFKNWDGIERRANEGNFFADALRNLSFHYNESDNFNAPSGVQVDFFNRRLPPPSGKGKDYGVGGSFFDNKLVVRLNWYEASNLNASSSTANTVVARSQRIDTASARRWAEYVVRIRNGQNPANNPDFHNNTVNPLTPAMEQQIVQLQWGNFEFGSIDWPNGYGGSITATESNQSKGKELQLTYNPTRSWTMKVTAGQQRASFTDAGGEVTAWLNARRPQWQALVAPDIPGELVGPTGNRLRLDNFWNGYGFTEGAAFNDAASNTTGPTSTPSSTYTGIVESIYFPMLAQQGQQSPGLREYSGTFLTNYSFVGDRFKGLSVGGSVRWQDKAIAGYHSLLDPSTYARPSPTQANITFPDLNRPIYVPAETNVDLWVSYTKRFSDKIRMKIQLNVRDALEDGGLQVIGFNQDGSPAQYRIKDPRTWFVTTTFDF
jgi:hypothetical protein